MGLEVKTPQMDLWNPRAANSRQICVFLVPLNISIFRQNKNRVARIAIHFSYLELYKRICRRSISLSLRKQSQYATEEWILRSTRTTQERWNNPKAKANATPLSSNFTSDTHTFYYDRAGPSYLYINHGDCSLIRLTVLRKFYFKHVARPLPFQIISRILAFWRD